MQKLSWPELEKRGITSFIRRDDELSTYWSGNKFYKLYYNIVEAQQQGVKILISFGGAYSNHIYALAAASKALGLRSIGFIRGHEPKTLSPTLKDVSNWSMDVHFLNNKNYKNKDISLFLPILTKLDEKYTLIPEGGENLAGVRGCIPITQAISSQLNGKPYTLCAASGTGSTLAGMIAGAANNVSCIGFSVLKGEDQISAKVVNWLTLLGCSNTNWQLKTGFDHGGYAKYSPELIRFMNEFEERNQLLLEPVYTAKVLWGIEALAKSGYWKQGSTVVALHSGGLQGRRGFTFLDNPHLKMSQP